MGDGEDDFTFATEKQRAVLELLANNRTSKEIAGALAVSEPAINRRIEVLRLRLGGITRHELVRRYRNWRRRRALSRGCSMAATPCYLAVRRLRSFCSRSLPVWRSASASPERLRIS